MLIAQISDTHIVPKGQEWKSKPETKTAERLKLIVNHLNSLDSQPSVVLVTGDTIDQGGKDAYAHLKDLLSPLSMPYYVIPGNHDEPEEMRAAFRHETYMPSSGFIHYVIDDYPVRLIALDTVIAQQDHGTLCQERLDWLHHALQTNTQKPTLIFMHHPPAKIGHPFLDSIRCLPLTPLKK